MVKLIFKGCFTPQGINSAENYAQDTVILFYNLGIIKGVEKGYVNPKTNISRVETVTITQKLYNKMNGIVDNIF